MAQSIKHAWTVVWEVLAPWEHASGREHVSSQKKLHFLKFPVFVFQPKETFQSQDVKNRTFLHSNDSEIFGCQSFLIWLQIWNRTQMWFRSGFVYWSLQNSLYCSIKDENLLLPKLVINKMLLRKIEPRTANKTMPFSGLFTFRVTKNVTPHVVCEFIVQRQLLTGNSEFNP